MPTDLPLTHTTPHLPAIEVILGSDLADTLALAGGEVRHPLLIRALQRELAKIWPGRAVVVTFDATRKSCVRSEDEAAPLAEGMPAIQAVLFDAHRYEWDGAALATPLEAIDYMLTRCQVDPDLGYLVGPGAQAFRLLCEAEASLRGEPLADVLARRGKSLAREPRSRFTEAERARASERAAVGTDAGEG